MDRLVLIVFVLSCDNLVHTGIHTVYQPTVFNLAALIFFFVGFCISGFFSLMEYLSDYQKENANDASVEGA